MLDPLDLYFKPIFDGVRLTKGLDLLVEIINYDDHTEYELRVSGLKRAPEFAFVWNSNDKEIIYSTIYDLQEGTNLEDDFENKLTGPFTELRHSKYGNKVELIGKVNVKDLTVDLVKSIFHYLIYNKTVIQRLWSVAVDWTKEDTSLKRECDEAMLKVYVYFRIFGAGLIRRIYRFYKNLTMHEIKASLNTLELIGLIDRNEENEYEIKASEASNYIEKQDIMNVINKEIKNHEN